MINVGFKLGDIIKCSGYIGYVYDVSQDRYSVMWASRFSISANSSGSYSYDQPASRFKLVTSILREEE